MPVFLGKVIGSMPAKFADKKVSIEISTERGNPDWLQRRSIFNFEEFFSVLTQHNQDLTFKSLIARQEKRDEFFNKLDHW